VIKTHNEMKRNGQRIMEEPSHVTKDHHLWTRNRLLSKKRELTLRSNIIKYIIHIYIKTQHTHTITPIIFSQELHTLYKIYHSSRLHLFCSKYTLPFTITGIN